MKNNGNDIINNENVECEYKENVIKYIEVDNINIVDLNNETYLRENKEFKFKVDFKNKSFDYLLKEKDYSIVNQPLFTELIKNDNDIILKYKLDEDEKVIMIHLL